MFYIIGKIVIIVLVKFKLLIFIPYLLCFSQLLFDLMVFREQALRLILDLSSTVITLLVSHILLITK